MMALSICEECLRDTVTRESAIGRAPREDTLGADLDARYGCQNYCTINSGTGLRWQTPLFTKSYKVLLYYLLPQQQQKLYL